MGDKSKRSTGWEWRMAAWGARHPGFVAGPAALGASLLHYGPTTTGILAGAAGAGLGAWYRGHPDSFDRWAAPRLRAFQRRWLSRYYIGPQWSKITEECGLVTVNKTTGVINHPRITRIRSYSPNTETVRVRLLLGQTPKQWGDLTEHLAVALNAERVGIEKVAPRILDLIVQRGEPFNHVILPPDIIDDPDYVDLSNVYLGETEFGTDWTSPLIGQHILVAGMTGSGKNSVTWNFVRAVAPLVAAGLVRLHVIDPKETEMSVLAPVAHRYATSPDEINTVVPEFWETMTERKSLLAEQGMRTFAMSTVTPLDLLIIDELGALTGYARSEHRDVGATLPLILSQARSLGGTVLGALQEPDKAVLPQRDLFTMRVMMRAARAVEPDMVLGEDMRKRGAIADEIPNIPESAGIGYMVRERTRTPVRVRAAYNDDNDITNIVDTCRGRGDNGTRHLRLVA